MQLYDEYTGFLICVITCNGTAVKKNFPVVQMENNISLTTEKQRTEQNQTQQ